MQSLSMPVMFFFIKVHIVKTHIVHFQVIKAFAFASGAGNVDIGDLVFVFTVSFRQACLACPH
jgi:hypothetical protein